jgi:hypothetical protein
VGKNGVTVSRRCQPCREAKIHSEEEEHRLKDERKRCGWKGEAECFSRTRVRKLE